MLIFHRIPVVFLQYFLQYRALIIFQKRPGAEVELIHAVSVKEHSAVGRSLMHMHRSSASIVAFLPGQVPCSSIRLSDEASLMLM